MNSTVLVEMMVLSGTISERKHLKGKKDLHLTRKKQNLIVNPSSPNAHVIQCANLHPPSHHGNQF